MTDKSVPRHHHSGSQELDVEDMIDRYGCKQLYLVLEECIAEHNRDWRKCQLEVKALSLCNSRMQEGDEKFKK
jgi:hypothetical protein